MRKNIAILTSSLAVVFFTFSLITNFVVENRNIYSMHSCSDSFILSPLSQKNIVQNITVLKSNLIISISANTTLSIDLLYDNKPFFLTWNVQEGEKTYLLTENGTWVVRFWNENSKNCSFCRYKITIKEIHNKQTKPYLWLNFPLLTLGTISTLIIIPIYYSDKVKYSINKNNIKLIITIIMSFMILFSYQVSELILGTSAPWVIGTSVSMEPTISNGDLVIIKGIDPKNLNDGDIILFQMIATELKPESFSEISNPILHRILYAFVNGDHWYCKTQGDNSGPDDWFVPSEGVLGKAVFILPKIGYILIFLERVDVKLFLIIFISAIFFFTPIKKFLETKIKNKIKGIDKYQSFKIHRYREHYGVYPKC